MSSAASQKVVLIAVFANGAIAVTKFLAAAASGSSAMISEGIHSVVDTGNQLLLLLGLHSAKKPPDQEHPFGHGKELYFWGLVVAILLFGMGGGMAIYEGIIHLMEPVHLEDPTWAYVVLIAAMIFEGYSWWIALKEVVAKRREGESLWSLIKGSKNPAIFTVFLEDTAALTGLIIALVGVFLSHWYQDPRIDGIASLAIGATLSLVALFLVWESKGLLLGESADKKTVANIRRLAQADEDVTRVIHLLTMHFGPSEILLNLELEFRSGLTSDGLIRALQRVESSIRTAHPELKRVFIEVGPFTTARAQDGTG